MDTRRILVAIALVSSVTACASANDGAPPDEGSLTEGSPQSAADGALDRTEGSDVTPRVDRLGASSARAAVNELGAAVVRLRDADSDEGEVTIVRGRFSAEVFESGRELAPWAEVAK